MKSLILAGALCAALVAFSLHAPRAGAQVATPDGYALFLQARELFRLDEPPNSLTADGISPAEILRRKRIVVANNAPALAKLREALKAKIAVPVTASSPPLGFSINAIARELARKLAQEADVRAADGDAVAAARSSLDIVQLGAQISSGATIQWLTGSAIASVGYAKLRETAPQLDAAQTRSAVTRLALIQIEVPTSESVLRQEEKIALELGRPFFEDPKERARMQADLLKPEGPKDTFTHQQKRALLALTPAQFETNVRAVFEVAAMRAAQPYQTVNQLEDLKGADPLTDLVKPSTRGLARFSYDRRDLENRFALSALRLRLIKLETGAYPETFETGTDPFSPELALLIYQRVGDSYVLYSVGPDGIDNGGAEIQTVTADYETGELSVSDRLQSDSTGDIIAPVL